MIPGSLATFGGLLCLFGGAFVLILVFQIIRNLRAQPTVQRGVQRGWISDSDIFYGDDGFWIRSRTFAPGSRIAYRYLLNGVPGTGTVIYRPGQQGHFIYTGGTPQQVEFTSAGAGDLDDVAVPPPVNNDDWPAANNPPDWSPPPSNSTGPSAY